MDTDAIIELLGDIGITMLSVIARFGEKLGDGLIYLYVKLGDFLDSLDIPIFTKTRILGTARVSGTLFALLIIYLVIINIHAYHCFSADKKIAVRNGDSGNSSRREMRHSEAKLLRVCFFGGAIGGFCAMHIYHHKTRKKKFIIGVTLMLIIQLCIYSIAIGFLAFWLYLR